MGHAPYSQGDDLRRVDWPAYGRTGKLVLRTFRPGREDVLELVCDTSASMRVGDAEKLRFAVRLAAAVGHVAFAGGQGVMVCAGVLREEIPAGARLPELLGLLRRAASGPQAAFPGNGGLAGHSRATRSLIISDGMDQASVVSRLAASVPRPAWVAVMARDEIVPKMRGRFRLVNAENDSALELDVGTEQIAAYGRELARHEEAWRLAAARTRTRLRRAIADGDAIDFLVNSRVSLGVLPLSGGGRQ
jgi:uncharacterized protein (DUF58 family)